MEVHVQPKTRSKMFCGCSVADVNEPPNTHVCEICLGLPGTLPAINRAAVEACIKTALALRCKIPRHTKFDRKNYMYLDLPKGYQISQYDLPMSVNGLLEVDGRKVRIRRVHLEEDTGKLVHAGDKLHKAWESYVDLNRAGVPLMEIVSEPDLRSADEARDYAIELRTVLRAIGASEADMEKGQLRAEPNVSIRRAGTDALGVKTELKNINSFRALHRAILYEVDRQQKLLETGGTVVQETRGWSEDEERTFSQRSKESVETGRTPAEIVAERGYRQVSDESELRVIAEAVIDANPKAVADYRNGKTQALNALLNELRKKAPQANPKVARELLLKLLS